MKYLLFLCAAVVGLLCVSSCQAAAAKQSAQPDLVILDIGHSTISGGAKSPDGRVQEFSFWYRYVKTVKEEIEKEGYRVIVCNRSKAPADKELAALSTEIPVLHFTDPDTGKRYPSKYHPSRIGAGMVCADYGIEQRPACMVFLHLNCIGSSWRSKPAQSLVLYNKNHGAGLGNALAQALNTEVFNVKGALDNKGKTCRAAARTEKSLGGAGWLNTLDDEAIPAAIIEAFFTDDRAHVDFMATPANAEKIARAVAHGITAWLAQRPAK